MLSRRLTIAAACLTAAAGTPAVSADRVDITVWNATIDPFGAGDYFGTYDCWASPPPYVTILANFVPVPMPGPADQAVAHDQINFELFAGPTLLYSMSPPNRTHWTGTWWANGSTTTGLPRFSVWWPHGQTGQWFRQADTQWVLGPSRTHGGRMPFSGVLTLADGSTFDCATLNNGPNPGVLLTIGSDRADRPADRIDFTITITDDVAAPWPLIRPGDLNRDGRVDAGDLITFLGCWFTGDTTADFNRSGAVTQQDIFDFLTAFLTG